MFNIHGLHEEKGGEVKGVHTRRESWKWISMREAKARVGCIASIPPTCLLFLSLAPVALAVAAGVDEVVVAVAVKCNSEGKLRGVLS